MEFQFAFKHMDSSDALKAYAEAKIREKIDKFVTKPIEAHVTFEVDKHEHTAHCSVVGGDGFSLQVHHSCGDMYGSIDKLVDKLEVQLKKVKEKLKDHKLSRKDKREIEHANAVFEAKQADREAVDAEDLVKLDAARRRSAAE